MLDEVKEIEAVTVSTPDHAHYPAAMHAIALGKHVCVQKPLANTLWESREMHQAAKKKGVITQMGNQGHTLRRQPPCSRSGSPRASSARSRKSTSGRTAPSGRRAKRSRSRKAPRPRIWTGSCGSPRPPIARTPRTSHPFKWRGFLEYGAGALGDMGCHVMDAIFWALDLGMPQKIQAEAEELSDIAWPRGATVKYSWSNVPNVGEFVLYWYEGRGADGKPRKPETPAGFANKELGAGGFVLVGSEGTVVNEGDQAQAKKMVLLPEERAKYLAEHPVEKTLPRSPREGNPQQEWTLAIKEGKPFPFMSSFDYSVPLTELCLLGALAMRCGRPIEWNSAKLEVPGMPEAQAFIKRPKYREGWEYSAAKI